MKYNYAITILLGILIGLILFVFNYAEGTSYFSSNPNACTNCHIMEPQFDSWQKSSHHTSATCVECHLPHKFIPKWIAKAENGFLHSKGFTFQNFPEPIMIKDKNKLILQENCIQCHNNLVDEVMKNHHPLNTDCLHCHSSVGHGNQIGIGKYTPVNRKEFQ